MLIARKMVYENRETGATADRSWAVSGRSIIGRPPTLPSAAGATAFSYSSAHAMPSESSIRRARVTAT
jgi:predicted aconitase with swiveling domain